MANAIVKWKPVAALQKIGAALEVIRGGRSIMPSPAPANGARSAIVECSAPAPVKPGEVVDLPRLCAIHGKPYAARYVMGADGRYRHAQTIKVSESLYLDQYAGNTRRAVVPARDTSEECCPWCGASGFGPVHCGTCGQEICYGRTAGQYFRCREGCAGHGELSIEKRDYVGVKPRFSHGTKFCG